MKNLLIMRHAKSGWSDLTTSDFDRPLNKRGINDAPMMGKKLLEMGKKIDLIISSSANRAASTAQLISQSINYENEIQFERSFYLSDTDDTIFTLQQISDKYNTVLLIGHNPTLESLVYSLISDKNSIIMPTASVASIIFQIDQWQYIESNSGQLEWFIKPKDFK